MELRSIEMHASLDMCYVFHENRSQWNCVQSFLNINHKTISSFLLKLFGEKILVKSVKVLSLSIKSINPIEKHPHVIESYACILKIFVTTKDLSINILIYFGMCSTPKLSK